jgi:hypothetical protein
MTDVDEPFRKAPTGQLADQVAEQLPKSERASELAGELDELLGTTEAAFYEGSASVLAEQAYLIPPQGGTSSGGWWWRCWRGFWGCGGVASRGNCSCWRRSSASGRVWAPAWRGAGEQAEGALLALPSTPCATCCAGTLMPTLQEMGTMPHRRAKVGAAAASACGLASRRSTARAPAGGPCRAC